MNKKTKNTLLVIIIILVIIAWYYRDKLKAMFDAAKAAASGTSSGTSSGSAAIVAPEVTASAQTVEKTRFLYGPYEIVNSYSRTLDPRSPFK